jgi:hypothetical protein
MGGGHSLARYDPSSSRVKKIMTSGKIYSHIPHPHIEHRKKKAPKAGSDRDKPMGPIGRFNTFLGLKITEAVGTMWCAYLFAALALVSLPEAIRGGTATLVAWIAQTFLQLVLLSIIIVGQKIAGEATDKRAIDTYNDAEAVLYEALEIQKHLEAQDAFLQQLIDELVQGRTSTGSRQPGEPSAAPSVQTSS